MLSRLGDAFGPLLVAGLLWYGLEDVLEPPPDAELGIERHPHTGYVVSDSALDGPLLAFYRLQQAYREKCGHYAAGPRVEPGEVKQWEQGPGPHPSSMDYGEELSKVVGTSTTPSSPPTALISVASRCE